MVLYTAMVFATLHPCLRILNTNHSLLDNHEHSDINVESHSVLPKENLLCLVDKHPSWPGILYFPSTSCPTLLSTVGSKCTASLCRAERLRVSGGRDVFREQQSTLRDIPNPYPRITSHCVKNVKSACFLLKEV